MVNQTTPARRLAAFLLSLALALGLLAGTLSLAARAEGAGDLPAGSATPESAQLDQGLSVPAAATPEQAAPAENGIEPLLETAYPVAAALQDGTVSIPASMDAYIQKSNGDQAYGNGAKSLYVKNANSAAYNRRTLVAFELTGQEAAIAAADQIVLQLYITYCDKEETRLLRIYDVGTAWDESTVTWNNAPAVTDETPIVVNDIELRSADITAKVLEIDVTEYVKSSGETGLGLLLGIFDNGVNANGDNSGFGICAKEGATDEKPGPTLKVINRQPVSVIPLTVKTYAGQLPELPATVTVLCGDGSSKELPVTWDPIDPQLYAAAGTFTVQGSVEGTSIPAQATVTVQPLPLNKNILVSALRAAADAVDSGAVDRLIPSVKAAFEAAHSQAQTVYDDPDTTNEAVRAAYNALQAMIWKLGYTAADKAALNAAIAEAEALDPAPYTEQSVAALQTVLEEARAVAANDELSAADQAEVDAMQKALADAIAALQLAATPTPQPSEAPTAQPTAAPTPQPTNTPAPQATGTPAPQPTDAPAQTPGDAGSQPAAGDAPAAAPTAAPAPVTVPKTSDAFPLIPLIAAACLVAAGIAVLAVYKKKKNG